MAGGRAVDRANESFRGLLLLHRGRSGLTQRDLAARVGVSTRAVQLWESGISYPSAPALQSLIAVLLEAGGFSVGQETAEVEDLWEAALREAPRLHTPLDPIWWATLRSGPAAETAPERVVGDGAGSAAAVNQAPGPREHWGEAPDVREFVGRDAERMELRQWVVSDRCRLVALLGLGGIGKTILTARLARDVAEDFELVYWSSLINAPSLKEWLANAIGFLSDYRLLPPETEFELRDLLLNLLRERRCLLVLDNLETVLTSEDDAAGSTQDSAGFRGLVRILAESAHQSCVLLTSREAPADLGWLSGAADPVRVLKIGSLSVAEARSLLSTREVWGDEDAWASLVSKYAGNSLALKVVSATIQQVFGGDIAAFIAYVKETYGSAVRGIRHLMDGQVERRLSSLELRVLRWLAIEREPVTFARLVVDLGPSAGRAAILEAVESLWRRSLIERTGRTTAFMLQSVVLEYVTDRLVEQAAEEITQGRSATLETFPLVKALSKEYVRRSQERLTAQPLLESLSVAENGAADAEEGLVALLDGWRNRPYTEQGYGPGNVVNLVRLLRGGLTGIDLSHLFIRQAYLQEVEAQDTSFADTHLSEVVLAEAFEPILSVALSADGGVVAAGTMGGEVRLWRVDDRTPLASVRGHTGSVYGVALSAVGDVLLSGAVDGRVRFSNPGDEAELAHLAGHAGGVYDVALSGDGLVAASSGVDGAIRLWSSDSNAVVPTLLGHQGVVYDVALSPDGSLLASGGEDGTVRLWATGSGACLSVLNGHRGLVRGVALSADGHVLASGGLDGAVRLWDMDDGTCLATLHGHVTSVWSVAVTPDGRLLASGGVDGSVRLWDVASRSPIATLQGHGGAVWSVSLSEDGRLVASGGVDGSVRLWETETRVCTAIIQGNTNLIRGVALDADGSRIVSSGVDGTIRLWDPRTGTCVTAVQAPPGTVYNLALNADGSLLATGELDGSVLLRRLPGTEAVSSLPAHTGAAYGVALSAAGDLIASGGIDGFVRLWQTERARCVATLEGHTGAVWGVALRADGGLLASGGQDGTIRTWDTGTGRCLRVIHADCGTVYCVALSGDGEVLASGGLDGSVRLWDPASGECLATMQPNAGVMRGVALSRDGRLLVCGGQDGTVQLWDVQTGTTLRIFRPERLYQRSDITGLTGVTDAQRTALLALGAIDRTSSEADSAQSNLVLSSVLPG
jgi:WD40 repeat protein/transcriptional regulator with XRE-family HTH domain